MLISLNIILSIGGFFMSSNLDSLWKDVLKVIKVELTEVSFNTWLKSINPISLSNKNIILGAPNEFTKGILTGRYYNLIKNSIKQVTGEDYSVDFIIPGEETSYEEEEVVPKFQKIIKEPNLIRNTLLIHLLSVIAIDLLMQHH